MDNCKICTGDFKTSPDELVLCDHHDGMAHLGCCCYRCSMDGKPCVHGVAFYAKK
jgi:hypothetical protein